MGRLGQVSWASKLFEKRLQTKTKIKTKAEAEAELVKPNLGT
jgi:hypothetical protein